MDEKLRKLWENASKHFSMPDYNQFVIDMKDPEKMSRLRNNLLEFYDLPPIDQMYKDFGVKKKDNLQPTSQKGSTVSTTKEKVQPISSEYSEKFDQFKPKEQAPIPFASEIEKSVEEEGVISGSDLIRDDENIMTAQPIKEEGFGSYLKNALDVGVSRVSKSIYDLPSIIYDSAAIFTNPIARLLGIEEASSEKFAETFNLKNIPSEVVGKRIEEKRKEIQEYNNKNGGDALTALENGNVLGAAKMIAGTTVESLPLMIPAFMSGGSSVGLGIVGASTASTKAAQLKEENPEMDVTSRTLNAVTTGTLEATLGQLLTGASGAVTKRILMNEGSKKGAKIITDSFKSVLENTIEKSPLLPLFGEMLEESLVSVGEQLTDISTGVKTDFDMREVINSGISATGMGGVNTVAIYGAKGYVSAKDYVKLKQINKSLSKLSNEVLVSDLPTEEKELLNKSIERLKSQGEKVVDNAKKKVSLLPEEVRKELDNTILNLDGISIASFKIKSNKDLSDEVKAAMLGELKYQAIELTAKKEEILSKEYKLNEFESLPDNEKIKIKEEASNILLKEAQDAGKTEINITDNQISDKALEIFTKNKETEAIQKQSTTEVLVQPETTVSKTVEEGTPESESETAPKTIIEDADTLAYKPEEVVETTDATAFAASQAEAIAQRKDDKLQVTPLTQQDAQNILDEGGKLFITEDGKAGAYVTSDGYMGGLFKQPEANRTQAAKVLQDARIQAGGKFFDAFGINTESGKGTTLEDIYIKNGFRPVARMTFNPEFAPDGWENTNLKNRPDNVFFVYDPTYKATKGEGQRIEDYDQAYELAKNYKSEEVSVKSEGISKLREAFGRKATGVGKLNTITEKVNIEAQAVKAKESISKLFPDVDIEVYYNESDYHEAIGEQDESGGTYFNNKVYINLTRASSTTVGHEVFHAILSKSLKSNTDIQNLTSNFVNSLINGKDKAVIQALADKVATIEQYRDVANEEVMAELFGALSGFGKKLTPETKSLVKRFLDEVAKILGLKKFTENELIDVLNSLSKKVAKGESIASEDIQIFKGGKVVTNPIQSLVKKSVGAFDVQYLEDSRRQELIENGLLSEVNDVSEFSGNQAAITSPDDMLAGTISIDGKTIFEGGGGVFFVTKYGDVWASGKVGTANTLAKMINDSLSKNDGRGLLVLTKGADQKLISSVSGVNSSLAILDVMLDQGLISLSDFRSAISGSVKNAGGIIKLSGSAKQLKSDVNEYFSDTNTTTFEKRGDVVKDIIGKLSQSKSVKEKSKEIIEFLGGDTTKKLGKGKTEIAQSLGDLVAGVAAEQLTKGLSVGDVYAIIEVNSEVEVVKDSHPSYPFHIRLKDGSKPKLILPKNRQNGSEVLKTSTGKVYRVGNVSVLSGSFNQDISRKKQVTGDNTNDVIKYAKDNGISDADTRSFLVESGLTLKQATDAVENYNNNVTKAKQAEEGINIIDNKFLKKLDEIKKFISSNKAYKPKSMQVGLEGKDGFIESQVRMASFTLSDLEKTIKKYKKDSKVIYENLELYMRGDNSIDLPDDVREVAFKMRSHIDSLSKQLIENEAVSGDLSKDNILENIGSYITRSYEVYNNKNWKDKVSQDIIDNARNYLRESMSENARFIAEKENKDFDTVLEKEVDAVIKKLLDKESAKDFVANSNKSSKAIGILKQRQDIPAPLRALMGEYTDISKNYAISVAKVATLVAQQNFLNKTLELGRDVFIFEKPSPGFETKIASEGSETMNPLNGMYTSKEIDEALKGGLRYGFDLGPAQPLYDLWVKSVGTVKYNKTILSPGTHAKNLLGNMYFMAANGYINPNDYIDAGKTVYNDLTNGDNEFLRDKLMEYTQAGIINQSATLRDLKESLSKSESLEERINKNLSKSNIRKGAKLAEDLYQAEDDLFKIIGYEINKRQYSKALFKKEFDNLTEAQKLEVKETVTEIVKNTLPNYSRLPEMVKLMKAVPVAGTFISFHMESLRTAYNTIDLAKKELADPRLRSIGARRLSSLVALNVFKYSVLSSTIGLVSSALGFGEDDEDELTKDARRFARPWSKNSILSNVIMEKGKLSYIDMSASDPWGSLDKAIIGFMNGEDSIDGLSNSIQELIGPYVNEDILLSTILKAKEDISSEKSLSQNTDILLKSIYKAFTPGAVTSAERILIEDKKNFYELLTGSKYTPKKEGVINEVIGQLSGYKTIDTDIAEAMMFKVIAIKGYPQGRQNDAVSDYNKAFREFEKGELTEKELDNRYQQANESYKNLMTEISKDYAAALRSGLTIDALKEKMKEGKMSKYEIEEISKGNIPDLKKKGEKKQTSIFKYSWE
jgi:hypothetical protein